MAVLALGSAVVAMGLVGATVFALLILWAIYAGAVALIHLATWRAARAVGAPLGLLDVVRMRFRKVDARQIIEAYRLANLAELDLSIDDLERHQRRGGRIVEVVEAMRIAREGRVRATWVELCRQDLAGEDVVQIMKKRAVMPTRPPN